MPNKPIKQDKKQFAVFRASNILANNFLPLSEALAVKQIMESNLKTVQISKISAGSVYKLIAIGLTVGFLPLFIIFGIMGAFGMEALTWNEESVTGLKALIVGPLMAVFMSLIFTAIIGSITVFGLWIFSFIKPLEIEYKSIES